MITSNDEVTKDVTTKAVKGSNKAHYFFPTLQRTVEAESLEEALKIIKNKDLNK